MQLEESALYTRLAEMAINQQIFQADQIKQAKSDFGKNIFLGYLSVLKGRICTDANVQKLIYSNDLDAELNLAGLMIPLVEPLVIPGTAKLIAVWSLKMGLPTYAIRHFLIPECMLHQR